MIHAIHIRNIDEKVFTKDITNALNGISKDQIVSVDYCAVDVCSRMLYTALILYQD